MRICHLTSVHPYTDVRIFHKECSSLAAAGYEVHFVAPNAPNEMINGVRLHGVDANHGSRLLRTTNTVRSVYRQALKIDAAIYHLHDPELLMVGLLLKAKNKRVIYDAHEDFPKTVLTKFWIPGYARPSIAYASEKIENAISRYMDLIVVANPPVCQRFIEIGCNVVNINNYPLHKELISQRVDWQNKQKSVCYLGNLSNDRGIFEMVAALENTEVNLLLAGKFFSEVERRRAIAMKGWQKVKELGVIDRNGIKQVLQKSMAGLSVLHPTPSYTRALPTKMFEYMASGIPVIISNIALWADIVKAHNCGLCVDPAKPNEIADAINCLMSNPEMTRVMGENGRKAITEKYNWEKESEKLFQSYHDILS